VAGDVDEFRAELELLRREESPPAEAAEFVAHTDGACLGNPGPGGWAAVIHKPPYLWHLYGHLSSTTNNRAEALGLLAALEWPPPGSSLLVRSDSQLTIIVFEGKWKARANPDIWQEIRRVREAKSLTVRTEWVRGHAGDPGNEMADRLAMLGATNGDATLVAAPRTRTSDRKPTEVDGLIGSTPWEKDFLKSVADQLRKGRTLSAKQQAIVDRIRARATPST
jgi:ribonuclease HI